MKRIAAVCGVSVFAVCSCATIIAFSRAWSEKEALTKFRQLSYLRTGCRIMTERGLLEAPKPDHGRFVEETLRLKRTISETLLPWISCQGENTSASDALSFIETSFKQQRENGKTCIFPKILWPR